MENYDKIGERLDRLCNKFIVEMFSHKGNMKVSLINFAEEYNKIWKQLEDEQL